MALTTALLSSAALAASAAAAPGLLTGFSDGLYLSAARGDAFAKSTAAGARVARINLTWRVVASGRPSSPRSPLDPAYDFSSIDAAVEAATAHGMTPMITVLSAPTYAEGSHRPSDAAPGSWKPSPGAYADFGAAVAQRYSGEVAGLPRVRYFQAWNEPNLSEYLTPQYEHGSEFAADRYRSMLNAFYGAVKSVHADNQVITGGTAPYGDPPGGDRTRPLTFWRDVFCLRGRKELKPRKCPTKPKFDILAHHPINTSGGPLRSAINPNDASTPDLKDVARTLHTAERHHTVGTRGRHAIWATELWWDSNPPDKADGVPVRKQARWLEQALYVLWKQGARVVINLQVEDSPFDAGAPTADNSTGVYFSDGTAKPSLTAWRFPLVADPVSHGRLLIWGKSPAAGKVVIQRKAGGGWRRVDALSVGVGDVFKVRTGLRGPQKLRAKIGSERSLVWNQR